MLLRSSSTPILTSLVPSSSPSHHHHHDHHAISCQFSSPISDANSENSSSSLRRTRSVDSLKKENAYVMNKHEEIVEVDENNLDVPSALPPLFLARGLGIDRLASGLLAVGGGCDGDGGGGDCGGRKMGNGGDMSDLEMFYKQMVEENPDNVMILRNYAEFLCESKGDFRRAEEYYSRAIIADPGDGEILSQYAKLVWEQHHDEDRAGSYFQQSVQAAPDNSHVLAAYAGFLWETEDDGNEDDDIAIGSAQLQDIRHNGAIASVSG